MSKKTGSAKTSYKIVSLLFVSTLFSVAPSTVFAERNTIDILIAGYLPSIDTSTRLDSRSLQEGTLIEFEEDLNLDSDKTLPALFVTYNFGKRMSVELGYFDLSRRGSLLIDETIDFGDETFDVDELVESRFNVTTYRVGFYYDFYQSTDWTLGAAIGAHITGFDVGIAAPEREAVAEVDETFPLPYLSLTADYGFYDRWHIGATIEYFSISTGDVDGSLLNASAAIDYSFSETMGAGLAYNIYDLSAESTSLTDDLDGAFEYKYSGPLLYLRFGF